MAVVVYEPTFLEPFRKLERQFMFAGKELTIRQDWEKHGVSAVVWDAAIVLAEYLENCVKNGNLTLDSKSVLELGAGTGLAGMVAALLGARVILTDRLMVIEGLTHNVKNNFGNDHSNIVIRELEWGKNLQAYFAKEFDFIIGADIIYIKETFFALHQTLSQLSHAKTQVLLSCRIRYEKDSNFLETLQREFAIDEVHFSKEKGIHIYKATKLPILKIEL